MNEDDKLQVLCTISLSESQINRIREVDERIVLDVYRAKEVSKIPDEIWKKTEVLLSSGAGLPLPEKAPNLRWLQSTYTGVETILDHPLVQSEQVVTTSASGVMVAQMGEYALMTLLMLGHKMPRMIQAQKNKTWVEDRQQVLQPRLLRGSTVGIVGYGSIGREIARQLYAYGAKVLAAKRDAMHPEDYGYTPAGLGDPEGNYFHRLYPIEGLRGMLSECDFVILTLPQTAETKGLFGKETIAAMKPGSYLINISRGALLDDSALLDALNCGHLAGAALDVFVEEPLPEDHPFWTAPNLIVTPHISAFSPSLMDDIIELFVTNLKRYLQGMTLFNQINLRQGY